MANLPLPLALLLMGFTFTVVQVMVIREFLVAFSGNELSTAIILANWLLLEAGGSFLLGKRVGRWGLREGGYAFLQLLLSALLPLSLYAIRNSRNLMGLAPGEVASLLEILIWTIPLLAPIGFLDGILFALGCALHSEWSRRGAGSIGHVYLLEAIGAGTGGLIYTFFAIPFLHSFQTASLLGLANLLSALLLAVHSRSFRRWRWPFLGAWGYFLLVNLLLLLPYGSQVVEKRSLGGLWPGFEVLDSRWSPFGNFTVGRREGQLTFFSNGVPVSNVPVPDVAFLEELVHYPLLLSPSPRKILVVGGAFGGMIREILKHPAEEVHYAEIDPLVIQFLAEHPTPLTRAEMEDPRVRVHPLDGRLFVKTWGERLDGILLNLPLPSTLELNRLYTVEFFREAFRLLGKEGVLAMALPGSETYLSPEARDLNRSILESLRETFSSVEVIPGETNVIIARATKDPESLSPERFIRLLQERRIQTQSLNPAHMRRKMEKGRLAWWEEALNQGEEPRLNRDRNPSGVYYGVAYWNAQFHPRIRAIWGWVGEFRLSHFGLALLAVVGAVSVYRKSGRAGEGRGLAKGALLWAVATTGFFGLAMSVLMILSFQTLHGYAYEWIGLLVGSFMMGMAGGTWMMNRALGKIRNRGMTLIGVEGFLAVFCLLLMLALHSLYSSGAAPGASGALKASFLMMGLVSGFWSGLEFPLSGAIYARREGEVGRTAGILYGADLFGAWAGALLVGVVFIPVLGILPTCGALVLLKLASLSLLSLAGVGREDDPEAGGD